MKITIIQTGGTIDKDYPKKTMGYAFEISKPAVQRIMKRLRPGFDYDLISLLKKDSLDLTSGDRKLLVETCREVENDKIIITHGTDSMIDTAEKLSGIKEKIIILTGSFLPERFKSSDADINLGTAIGAAQTLTSGIYIAMNGLVVPWDKAERNKETGQFFEK